MSIKFKMTIKKKSSDWGLTCFHRTHLNKNEYEVKLTLHTVRVVEYYCRTTSVFQRLNLFKTNTISGFYINTVVYDTRKIYLLRLCLTRNYQSSKKVLERLLQIHHFSTGGVVLDLWRTTVLRVPRPRRLTLIIRSLVSWLTYLLR